MPTTRLAVASLGMAGVALLTSVAGASTAAASSGRENNKNVVGNITLNCPFGQVSGSGGPGGAFFLADGGGAVATLQGLVGPDGTVFSSPTPGLERRGELVECTYFSERRNAVFTAHVDLLPRKALG